MVEDGLRQLKLPLFSFLFALQNQTSVLFPLLPLEQLSAMRPLLGLHLKYRHLVEINDDSLNGEDGRLSNQAVWG